MKWGSKLLMRIDTRGVYGQKIQDFGGFTLAICEEVNL
jgi:hypothetical protein